MDDKKFSMRASERAAMLSCLVDLDQARIDLEARDRQDGKDDGIVKRIENCHDGLYTLLNGLKTR